MKKSVISSFSIIILAMLLSSGFNHASAQNKTTTPKIYAVINKADWCPVCQSNGPRVMKEVLPACKDLNVKFVANDLTSDETIEKSTAELKSNNVFNAVKDTRSTGVILLIDAESKQIIKKISVAKSTAEIVKEITAAQS